MARIAVYSENPYGKESIQAYLENACIGYGLKVQSSYYDSEAVLAWDMEMAGLCDLVIVYRDWRVAVDIRKRFRNANIMMISLGMNRMLYDIQPCYQLYEPMGEEEFMQVFMDALGENEYSRCFSFCSEWIRYRLNIHEIMYFESDGRVIHVRGLYRDYKFYGSLKELEPQVKELYPGFARVHSSFIVNVEYIRSYSYGKIAMLDGTSIAISSRWKSEAARCCESIRVASIKHISAVLC